MIKKTFFIILFVSFLLLNVHLVYAEENISIQQQAEICLNESREILNEIIYNNFSYQRINDSLNRADDLYDAQITLLQKKKEVDFSIILPYCEEIKTTRDLAFDAQDQYSSLKRFYSLYVTSDMNSSEIDILLAEIEDEINSERYEKVPSLIDNAYEEITRLKYANTTLNLFYNSTTRSLKKFFQQNGLTLVITLSALLILFLIFRKKIKNKIVENKIKNLELRKKTLQDLIKHTQTDYFQHGKMSESNYNLRTKKFAEFIRDIDREIPLLKEEILKMKRGKKRK